MYMYKFLFAVPITRFFSFLGVSNWMHKHIHVFNKVETVLTSNKIEKTLMYENYKYVEKKNTGEGFSY